MYNIHCFRLRRRFGCFTTFTQEPNFVKRRTLVGPEVTSPAPFWTRNWETNEAYHPCKSLWVHFHDINPFDYKNSGSKWLVFEKNYLAWIKYNSEKRTGFTGHEVGSLMTSLLLNSRLGRNRKIVFFLICPALMHQHGLDCVSKFVANSMRSKTRSKVWNTCILNEVLSSWITSSKYKTNDKRHSNCIDRFGMLLPLWVELVKWLQWLRQLELFANTLLATIRCCASAMNVCNVHIYTPHHVP